MNKSNQSRVYDGPHVSLLTGQVIAQVAAWLNCDTCAAGLTNADNEACSALADAWRIYGDGGDDTGDVTSCPVCAVMLTGEQAWQIKFGAKEQAK